MSNDVFEEKYRYYAYPVEYYKIAPLGYASLPIKNKELENRIELSDFNELQLLEWLEEYANTYCSEFVCILKIPECYFGYLKETKEITPCMPLIITNFDYFLGESNGVSANFILGIYDTKIKEYTQNTNYNPFFEPHGLQFTDEQVETMKKYHNDTIVGYALARRNIPYLTLRRQDELSGVFNSTIKYYNSLANQDTHTKNRTKSLT